jgi:hypothetical protein
VQTEVLTVECRCSAVAVELAGEPIAQLYCHCGDCQRIHGAAYVPVALYRADAVRVTRGTPHTWKLKTTPRRTCGECGTWLFAEPNDRLRGVIAYLLPAGRFKPEFHIHCGSALLPIRDGLPHYETVPARLGGSDDVVDW